MLGFIVFVCSCGSGSNNSTGPIVEVANPYIYTIPEAVNNDWQTGHASNYSIQLAKIEDLFNRQKSGEYKSIHSLLIVRNGVLVVEEYFSGNPRSQQNIDQVLSVITYDKNTLHYQASTSKSFVSAMIGIAMNQGLIDNIEQLIAPFFSDYSDLFSGDKSNITIENLLTMRAGLEWQNGSTSTMDHDKNNWVEYILNKSMESEPGSTFHYHEGQSVLLAEITARTSSLSSNDFVRNFLFQPLGIEDYYWITSASNELAGGWGLFLRPRDMARFGQLYLNNGIWNGTQIIPANWINFSTKAYNNTQNYAYHWWANPINTSTQQFEMFSAAGAGGQRIFVVPALDIVVIFTMGDYGNDYTSPETMMQRHIIPAML